MARVQRSIAQHAADAVNDERLATELLDAILESLLAESGPESITLDVEDRWYTHDGAQITLHYPFLGTSQWLQPHAQWIGQWSSRPRFAGTRDASRTVAEIMLTATETESPDFEQEFAEGIAQIDAKLVEAVAAANKDIARQQAQFIEEARDRKSTRLNSSHWE